eukprot:12882127-Prorocentrum_lima.AAC.1
MDVDLGKCQSSWSCDRAVRQFMRQFTGVHNCMHAPPPWPLLPPQPPPQCAPSRCADENGGHREFVGALLHVETDEFA